MIMLDLQQHNTGNRRDVARLDFCHFCQRGRPACCVPVCTTTAPRGPCCSSQHHGNVLELPPHTHTHVLCCAVRPVCAPPQSAQTTIPVPGSVCSAVQAKDQSQHQLLTCRFAGRQGFLCGRLAACEAWSCPAGSCTAPTPLGCISAAPA
jgi:hypothetical protein